MARSTGGTFATQMSLISLIGREAILPVQSLHGSQLAGSDSTPLDRAVLEV